MVENDPSSLKLRRTSNSWRTDRSRFAGLLKEGIKKKAGHDNLLPGFLINR